MAQRREVWDRITLEVAAWFSQPLSHTAGLLYVLPAVVAAGKTLMVPALGWALNYAIRTQPGRPRRVATACCC